MPLSLAKSKEIVARVGLTLAETPVCLACLSVVAADVRKNDERNALSSAYEMTPLIWVEGLAEPALEAVRRAAERGVEGADVGLADLESRGSRSPVARAIVLRFAAELVERERRLAELHRRSRTLLGPAPPEWN
jgi:hypothetical protein